MGRSDDQRKEKKRSKEKKRDEEPSDDSRDRGRKDRSKNVHVDKIRSANNRQRQDSDGYDSDKADRKKENRKRRRLTEKEERSDDPSNVSHSKKSSDRYNNNNNNEEKRDRTTSRHSRQDTDFSHNKSKHNKKKKKSHHRHHHDDEKNDSKKIEKKDTQKTNKLNVDKSKLYHLGEIYGRKPDTLLDPEQDYFSFHQHFWLYLYREKQITFNDLTSDEARSEFTNFVKAYNRGRLEHAYYNTSGGLPLEALDEIKTTQHQWGFHITNKEGANLQMLQEGIRKQTEYSSNNNNNTTRNPSELVQTRQNTVTMATPNTTMDHPLANKNTTGTSPDQNRSSYRRRKEHIRTVEDDEFMGGGRKEGRERQIEKRKEMGNRIHGAARDRDDMATTVALSDDVLYGTSDNDFQNALAAQKRRDDNKNQQKESRFVELRAKEEEKQKIMLQMLGLSDTIKPGEKIKIQPRNNP